MADLGTQSLSEMYSEVLGLLGKPASPGMSAKITASLNRQLEMIAKQGSWPTLTTYDESSFLSPSNSSVPTIRGAEGFAPLPWGCRNVQSITLREVERREVKQVSPEELNRRYSPTQTGIPECYAIVGETIQHTPLSSSALFELTGASVNDDTATARIWYRTQSGHLGEVVSPAFTGTFSGGVTAPAAGIAGWPLQRMEVSSLWAGDITITSGGTEIAKIATPFGTQTSNPMQRVETRPLIRLGPTPDQDYTAVIVARRVPRKLVKNDDVPEIPVSTAMVYGAAADLCRVEKRHSQANQFERKKMEALSMDLAGENQQGGFAAPQWGNYLDATGLEYEP